MMDIKKEQVDKLEIGCGRKPHKGYKTVDVEAYANPDYLGDFRKMCFVDVDVLRAHHVFEHFSREEAIEILKQWHSWLRPGGTLIIETPDIEGICKQFEQSSDKDKYWLTRHLYGSQEAPWAFHRDGWYANKFKKVLENSGFVILRTEYSKSRKILPNITVYAKKQ